MTLDPALDLLYNLRGHPDRETVYAALEQRGDVFKARMQREGRIELDVAYAPHARACLDVFKAKTPRAVLVFFHGGYWRALDKSLFSALAEAFVARDLTMVMPSYPLAPQDAIPVIVDHAQLALDWVRANHPPDVPIIVSGHSAGAHLAAMTALAAPPARPCAGSILISGLFDLEPLRFSNVNTEAQLGAATAATMSPTLLNHEAPCNTLLIVGADETDGFKTQTNTYAAVLETAGARVSSLAPEGLNHFTILAPFAAPGAQLHQQVCAFIEECLPHHGGPL